jgi:uncharacterized protein YdeI (BOF family)
VTPRRADTRAVTVPTDYILLVGITALLASGLIVGTGGFVRDQQTQAVRTGFEVVGNGLANDLTTVDRLADSVGDDGRVAVTTDLPESIAGTTYQVTVESEVITNGVYSYEIILTSTDPQIQVSVPFRTSRPVAAETLDGGPVVVSATPDELVVRDD